nr:peptide chain release factor N(5)-glutamine methyltransferase [uncultured Mediterraneibacter sp.]
MTLKHAYEQGIERLKNAGIPEPQIDAWYLLEYVTGIGRAAYYADPDRQMSREQSVEYENCLSERSRRVPLQHITGVQEFMGLSFCVNKDVLIPRQDTEILVEEALEILKMEGLPSEGGRVRILDLCTGSGCILLSVLHWSDRKIEGVGSDVSERALMTAKENARRLNIKSSFVQSDLFENLTGKYVLILSNPPYIESGRIESLQDEVRIHDPLKALDGGEDGLSFYRRIIKESKAHLEEGGYLVFEIGCDQAEAVTDMMRQAGFEGVAVKRDLAGLDRVVYGRYIK